MDTHHDAYREKLAAFGRQLKRIHRDAGEPSLRSLAKQMGYGHATIHRHLNGQTLPRGEFISDFLTALNVNTGDLYPRLLAARNEIRELIDPIGEPAAVTGDVIRSDNGVVWAEAQFDARRRRA